ncbi:alpha-amylase [Tatumella citrea]|uniref:Alpha-amylase n=1 Tax=Tatumella citrea TaxID=53336 RepID=A0A1Y0LII1_TATCI|nr:alpha-amylase [Tatumella citrea]ARU93639.1 alpha-amylase [Tatumella citrea]ARU97677.1 alpha-amylase [Tatumella citrea]
MKPLLLSLLLFPGVALAQWSATGFSDFRPTVPGVVESEASLTKGVRDFTLQQAGQCWQPEQAVRLNQSLSLRSCTGTPPQWRIFRDGDYRLQLDTRSGTPTLMITVRQPESDSLSVAPARCPVWNGKPLSIDVSSTFAEGSRVREFYSSTVSVVKQGHITLAPASGSDGLLLLESADTTGPAPFSWHNATVYFALTDRFANGNPANDHSYGRKDDGMQNIATFHGGDLQGLTGKLDYLQQLGVNALWISSPLEQIHGWIGGGAKGDFPHYAYHGYYALDWTRLDANMGTAADLQALVTAAHKRGIRILFDVVVNHTGYATLADMQEFGFGALYLSATQQHQLLGEHWTDWTPGKGQTWHSYNDYINFSDKAGWSRWWGKDWVRSDIGDYDAPGYDDLTMSLAFLPDLKTESPEPVALPYFLQHKPDTGAKTLPGYTVRDYLTHWLSQWVRDYGIDGFRVDTAKHVDKATLRQLKAQSVAALAAWKQANPEQKPDDAPFWMTGEAWGHGVMRSIYYDNGFDAMINFDYQEQAAAAVNCFASIDSVWQQMSGQLQTFNVLSYLSSHDTRLFREGGPRGAELLMLAPGAVQLFYGDETARAFGPTGSDPIQGTRSDMNWPDVNGKSAALLAHWQKLGQFRARHPAIGAGQQTTLPLAEGYGFTRQLGDDKVMVVWVGQH